MGKGESLSQDERIIIPQKLAEGLKPSQIARLLDRDTRTIKKAIMNINFTRKTRSDRGKFILSARDLRKLKSTVKKQPLSTSKSIFNSAGLGEFGRTTRCKALKMVSRVTRAVKRPYLTIRHCKQRMSWSRQYMKLAFENEIFTDESRVTLDGPDGWRRGWVLDGERPSEILRRQQGGGGIMIWAGIVNDRIIGPFKVDDGVKMNSANYTAFLNANFFTWYRAQPRGFKTKCMFMHDNAPAHASQFTGAYLASKGIKETKIMEWPSQSPDLNPIENLWSIVKSELYLDNKQYSSKKELWESLQRVCAAIKPEKIKNLKNSMDDRLFKVVQANGGYIHM